MLALTLSESKKKVNVARTHIKFLLEVSHKVDMAKLFGGTVAPLQRPPCGSHICGF